MSGEELTPGEKVGDGLAEAAAASAAASLSTGSVLSGRFAPGGVVMAGGGLVGSVPPASTSSGPIRLPGEAPPARKPLEHVVMPQRLPKRVLVAFLDEDGNPEPFWAAYLEPQDIQISMTPLNPEDAVMDLRLSLVKKFRQ